MKGKVIGVIVAPVEAVSSGGGIFGLAFAGFLIYLSFKVIEAFFGFLFAHPDFSVPITFLLVALLSWFVTSSSVGADRAAGVITLFILGLASAVALYVLADSVFGVWLPTIFVSDSIMPYFSLAHTWVQSLDNILLYWLSSVLYYPVALVLVLVIYIAALFLISLPLLLCGSFFYFIGSFFEENGLRIIGDLTFLTVILGLSHLFLSSMEYDQARPMINSYEANMIALTVVSLITSLVGWLKFKET